MAPSPTRVVASGPDRDQTGQAQNPSTAPADPAPSAAGRASGLALTALTFVLLAEFVRVLFTSTYHTGDEVGLSLGDSNLGFAVVGALVVAMFAAPVVAPLLRRLAGPSPALAGTVGALALARVGLQAVGDVPFALAAAGTAIALVTLALAIAALRSSLPDGAALSALGVSIGLAVDLALRAAGSGWDLPWRDDPVAWTLSMLTVAGLVGAVVACMRTGIVPDHDDPGAGLAAFTLWPYVFLAVFYVQSPAFLDSSAGVPLAVGFAVALLDAVAGVVVLAVTTRAVLPRAAVVLAGLLAGVGTYLLATRTGPAVLGIAGLTQVLAAAALGATAGAARGTPPNRGVLHTGLGLAGGAVVFGVATLLYTIDAIVPLPFSNRVVPAVVVALLALGARAPTTRAIPMGTDGRVDARLWPAAAGLIGALAVAVPLALALTAPADPAPSDAATARRQLTVMTFNIQQGEDRGQLDLERLARTVDAVGPDVVVMEEVGRGWSLSGMTDETEWFRRRLAMPYAWAAAADNQFGNAVFSRVPITGTEVLELGKGNGTQARSAVLATLDVGGGRQALVIGAHLQNGSEAPIHDTRADSYRTILAAWGGRADTVFLGDLNTYPRLVEPGWPELNLPLDAGFHTTQDLDRCTMPTSNENCPDWIFASADVSIGPVGIAEDRPDHRPVVATVTLRSDAG